MIVQKQVNISWLLHENAITSHNKLEISEENTDFRLENWVDYGYRF